MSNLNNNTTQLELLLSKVNALPEAGGGSVETCTVTVSFINSDPRAVFISGTQLEDGNIVPFTFVDSDLPSSPSFSSPLTIANIVKNTIITVVGNGQFMLNGGMSSCTGCEIAYYSAGSGLIAIKVTDTTASCEIMNDY